MKNRSANPRLHTEQFLKANRTCAAIILADPMRYGGDGSLMVEWAKLVVEGESANRRGPGGW